MWGLGCFAELRKKAPKALFADTVKPLSDAKVEKKYSKRRITISLEIQLNRKPYTLHTV